MTIILYPLNFSLLATGETTAANDDVGSQLTEVKARSPADIPAVVFKESVASLHSSVWSRLVSSHSTFCHLPSPAPNAHIYIFLSCQLWQLLFMERSALLDDPTSAELLPSREVAALEGVGTQGTQVETTPSVTPSEPEPPAQQDTQQRTQVRPERGPAMEGWVD